MLAHHIHRVLVTEDGTLRGIISTFDLLRVLVSSPQVVEAGAIRHVESNLAVRHDR